MKRLHLFEFNDLSWWPSSWKHMETDYLSMANRLLDLYKPAVSKLGRILRKTRCSHVVDLCSGGARHWVPVLRQLEDEQGHEIHVTLTDIQPNVTAYEEAHSEDHRIGYTDAPVDATQVPPHLDGFRTIFAGLHHFKPHQAARILRDAVESREGIAILEHTYRSPSGIFPMIFTPLLVWLLTPFIRPMTVARFFWTYIVPVIPLTILWDGLVSALRSYSTDELLALVRSQNTDDYVWQSEVFRVAGVLPVTLLIGYPNDPAIADSSVETEDASPVILSELENKPGFAAPGDTWAIPLP